MNLIKKLIRIIPIFVFVYPFLILIFNDGVVFNSDFLSLGTWYDDNYQMFFSLLGVFENVLQWFKTNLINNIIFDIAFSILVYELYISFAYLIFDILNMFIGIANKFIKGGANID